jgi:hypothetical protein
MNAHGAEREGTIPAKVVITLVVNLASEYVARGL